MDALVRHGVREDDVEVAWVPGAFEIPLVTKRLAATGRYDAVLCLGAVIRGSTPHFDYVAAEVSKGVAHVGLETGRALRLRRADDRHDRAGDRAGRHQGRQQGLRRRGDRDRDGQPASADRGWRPRGALVPLYLALDFGGTKLACGLVESANGMVLTHVRRAIATGRDGLAPPDAEHGAARRSAGGRRSRSPASASASAGRSTSGGSASGSPTTFRAGRTTRSSTRWSGRSASRR